MISDILILMTQVNYKIPDPGPKIIVAFSLQDKIRISMQI